LNIYGMNSVDVFATVKIHREHNRSWVAHLWTSGTTSHKPLSNDWMVLCVGDANCRCCKRWSHKLLNSANVHTAWQFMSVHDLFW
jgi:hypothetical protein